MFVAGLEFVSEIFVSGVEVGGDMGERKSKKRTNGAGEVKLNGHNMKGGKGTLEKEFN